MPLLSCEVCKWKYPDNILNEMTGFKDNPIRLANVCGICALQITNDTYGMNRIRFDGPIAEHCRQMAIKWRKYQLHHAPKIN